MTHQENPGSAPGEAPQPCGACSTKDRQAEREEQQSVPTDEWPEGEGEVEQALENIEKVEAIAWTAQEELRAKESQEGFDFELA